MERYKEKISQKVCHFADGIVYACGIEHKLLSPNHSVIDCNTDSKEVGYHPSTGDSEPERIY